MFYSSKGKIVILSGGDYPSHPLPLKLLAEAERIVCCDGAAYELIRHGINPWRIIGDCDSILSPKDEDEQKILEECRDIIRRYTGQDDNDQTKAVKYCLDHGFHDLIIVGATGRREDHTLGNISLLLEYLRMGARVEMVTDYGIFIPCHDHIELDVEIPKDFRCENDTEATRRKSTQISVFNISARNLRADGLRYPLYDFGQWWQGTLNEAISPHVRIEGEGEFLVFVNYLEAKV